MRKIYDLRMQQDGFEISLPLCLSLEDAKHATNLFTVDADLLGPIFLVALTESDGLPSHVCRSCKRRAFKVEKLYILEHQFRFSYLTEDI